MSYDREAIKQFICDYSKENHDTTYNDKNTNIDDFFSLSDEVEPFELSENTSNQVFFNELDQLIYTVGTRGNTTYFSYYVKGNL